MFFNGIKTVAGISFVIFLDKRLEEAMGYISVSDAVEKTGKGQTTIYRLCRKHEHTRHVLREDKKFLIDEEFLCKHYSEQEPEHINNHEQEQAKPTEQGLMEALLEHLEDEKKYYRRLVERKDEQLERKDKIIANLQERQRELHHLLHQQTQLLDTSRQSPQDQEPAAAPADQPANPDRKQESKVSENPGKNDALNKQIRIVYAVLSFVMLLLILAIVYVDEIRAFVET